jgi:DNA polymerase III sliding clamp (beta) subunit (PCNA family)
MVANGRANLLCTDTETYSSASLDAGGSGHFCVDAGKFIKMLDCLTGEMVEIDVEDHQITMKDERSKLSLRTFEGKFPEDRMPDGDPTFKCEAGDFAAAVSFVEPCVGWAHKSFVFGAICLRVLDNQVEAWAMDGAMFAGAFLEATVGRKCGKEDILVPPSLATLVNGISGEMECWIDKASITIKTAEDIVTTRRVEGRYCDVRKQLIDPHRTVGAFTCKAGDLKKAFSAAKLVCANDEVAVELLLRQQNIAEVRAPNKITGEVETKVLGERVGEADDAATFDVERAILGMGCFEPGVAIIIKGAGPKQPWLFEIAPRDGYVNKRVVSLQPNVAKVQER